ncbi:DUF4913 domain-containing protein [Hamadaea tsunoensis]|uniref:DUF4913 domain-containing protein n=1 Tax=Hamadaea tsunoensis TaxID=53368 RepID=UPI00040C775B|nr:DUF4913 domain-containing protein [Hamadaea tsunoensis]
MTDRDALDALLDELSQQGQQAPSDPREIPADGTIEPAYANLASWAADWLLPTVERRVAEGSRGGIYWCAQWWAHPEGLQRIYALWREWERARIEENMSGWWRDHLDPHLRSLTGEHGPFVQCSPARHYPPAHLPAVALPDDILGQLPEG